MCVCVLLFGVGLFGMGGGGLLFGFVDLSPTVLFVENLNVFTMHSIFIFVSCVLK